MNFTVEVVESPSGDRGNLRIAIPGPDWITFSIAVAAVLGVDVREILIDESRSFIVIERKLLKR